MRPHYPLLLLFAGLLVISSCEKDNEPFEYPEENITEPTTVTHMVRELTVLDNWTLDYAADGCSESFPTETFAQAEFSPSRGFISMYLVPDTNVCSAFISAETKFTAEEFPSDYWDNWRFEFTFSELQLNDTSELRMEFDWREVSFDLDIADIMRERLTKDSTVNDTDGVFVLEYQGGFTNFYLNGYNFSPDFSAESGNSFSKTANVTVPRFALTARQEGTDERTLIVFNYLRVTSYGILEQ